MFSQSPAEQVESVLRFVFCFAAFKTSFELEPHSVHWPGGKRNVMSVDTRATEDQIEKLPAIALLCALTGDNAGGAVRVQVDLKAFASFPAPLHPLHALCTSLRAG